MEKFRPVTGVLFLHEKKNFGSGKNAVHQESDILALVERDDRIYSETKGTQK
jgi:hypothetical protein